MVVVIVMACMCNMVYSLDKDRTKYIDQHKKQKLYDKDSEETID